MEYTGISAASGYALGPAFLLQDRQIQVLKSEVTKENLDSEILRFEEALRKAAQDLEEIKERARQTIGSEEAEIFTAHILVLQDPEYSGAIKDMIRSEARNVEWAVQAVTDQFLELFASMDNDYIRERAADLRDVSSRLLRHLLGISTQSLSEITEKVILVAYDLTPSDTAQLDRDKVVGIVTNIGGRTSHSAIMARSMEIPAVVGVQDIMEKIKSGEFVIVDGSEGKIIVNPTEDLIQLYKEKQLSYEAQREELKKLVQLPSMTPDGIQVELIANIGNPKDGLAAVENGAEGIGLYRTEFLYMGREALPSEEEQFEAYKSVTEMFGREHPVVIRSLDIGGDKELPYLDMPKEMNPFLGYRAIRLCLDRTDIFRTQLRAILRASAYGNIKLMYPMIATLEELRKANKVLETVKQELLAEAIPFNKGMEVGIMVEIPAVAVMADRFAREVDFFSIGTNDLIQYTMAADRMNETVSYLYQPFNLAVLRLIRSVIESAHKEGKRVAMCGEMAGDLTALPILLGLGLDEFSMSASSVLLARALVRQLTMKKARSIAEAVLEMDNPLEIENFVKQEMQC
ncbi:phosphoenolpyruvate--protein phosphotransferase [Desulfosporosinus fructosivorans]|uniref:Phosphoenolpyruvate-protein phosphotransferase n=1 Tax=Desulfosporosinus fructosivorans TaxID=2018669 RepID=A0A4Z0R8W9_9FIRM|nr:phosphoenolpyruvate--protein phosphotransferase [Desulfosporosinus fructosivorans]TGE39621.1 phosphoenolpyruvate--protein phosphotransferase [Desulfosporosinus fructosivorans]